MPHPRTILAHVLAAGAIASSAWAGAIAAPAQTDRRAPDGGGERAFEAELVAYLRCEPDVPRDAAGEVATPRLLYLTDRYTARAPSGAMALPITVWNGAEAKLEVVAGYGFFGVIQHYPAGSAPVILADLAKAGWDMERKAMADVRDRTSAAFLEQARSLVVREGRKRSGAYTGTLTMVEARADLAREARGEFPYSPDGVTLYCGYSRAGEPWELGR